MVAHWAAEGTFSQGMRKCFASSIRYIDVVCLALECAILLFILSWLSQGWQCALMYTALLVPMDMAAYYFDIFAYDVNELFWVEVTMAVMLNSILCACLVPAYAAHRLMEEERPYRSYMDYGGVGKGVREHMPEGGGGFKPFQGQGNATGYGRETGWTKTV